MFRSYILKFYLLQKGSREREQNISILTILDLSFLISNMTLLILLLAIKILARLSIFKYIEKKHGRLVLENIRSLEKAKRKWFNISKDINFIKTFKIENLLPTFSKVKLAIKSGNKKIQLKIPRIIMNTELQQKYHEKRKLKREIIQLSIKLKVQVGLVLFNGVVYSLDKSIKQKSITVTKRHEKKSERQKIDIR